MTAPVQEAVRDTVQHACNQSFRRGSLHGCDWPECGCTMTLPGASDFFATLIAQARAEGAAQEREACAKVAEERQVDDQGNALWLVWPDGHDIAAAIRARKEEPKP